MAVSLREQLTTTNRGKVPTRDPDRTTGVSVEKRLISPAKRSLEHISGGEAAFRSVLMGAMIGAPITDSKAVDGAITALDNGTAALHERAVSTFSATLEQAANTVSPEFMLEQVTQVVQTYEQKHDEAWVNTPEETVRRAAEARGYNPNEITGGRSEILLRDLEKIRLQLEAGEKVTAFEILETFIFQSLGRYEDIASGDVVAVWKDGEKEYPSKQDAWEDVLSSQTLLNVMNETLATLAGSQAAPSDPAAPPTTQEPTDDITSPTEAPSAPTDNPEPTATPDIATPEPVPTVQQNLDISNEADQITVIEQTTQSDKYVYVNETTITPPEGVTLEGGRSVFLDNANIQREVIRGQGLALGYTSVHVRSDELVNTVTTFNQAGTSIYIPAISVDGQTFYSSSTSKAYFDVEIPEGTKPKYEAVLLPPNTNPESVTVRFQGEAEILEVTDNVGNQWVWDFRKGEFVSMIDRPATAEMRAALPDYVAAYARTAQPGQEELFKTPEVVIDRLEETASVAKDGTAFKALIDPQTGTILFLKTQNQETGEWEWKPITGIKNLGEIASIVFGSENRITSNFFEELNGATIGVSPDWIRQYGWSSIDSELETLKKGGINPENIILSGALMGHQAPDWLIQENETPDKLEHFIIQYITDLVSYGKKNGISTFTIVNEPYFSTPSRGVIRPDFFHEKLGDKYYEIAFSAARNAYPEGTFILNDDGNHYDLFLPDGRINVESQAFATYKIAKQLKDVKVNGKPVLNAVGFQMHIIDMDWVKGGLPNKESIRQTLQAYNDLGYEIHVTEFDYAMHNFEGSPDEKIKRQAEVYYELMQILLDLNVKNITFWGMDDTGNNTWYYDMGINNAKPTMFEGGKPKLNYFAALKALSEYILR